MELSAVAQGIKAGSAIIGGKAIKFTRGQKLVAEIGRWSIVENTAQPVKGWVNYRLLVDDARRRKVSYQIAFSVNDERMADNVAWRRLKEDDAEIAVWAEKEVLNEFRKKYS